jgi:hypothetical protein
MDGARSVDKGDDRLGQCEDGLEVEPVPDIVRRSAGGQPCRKFFGAAAGGAGKIARTTVS